MCPSNTSKGETEPTWDERRLWPSRRSMLGLVGAGATSLLAGCLDGDGAGGTDDGNTDTSDGNGSGGGTDTTADGGEQGTDTPDETDVPTETPREVDLSGDELDCPPGSDRTSGGIAWTAGRDWDLEEWTRPEACTAASDLTFEDLSFTEATSYHARSVLPPALVSGGEDFESAPGGSLLDQATPGTADTENGMFVFDGEGVADARGMWRSDVAPEAPYASIVCPVECVSTVGGTRAYLGLATEDGDYIAAFYDPSEEIVGLEAVFGDTVRTLGTEPMPEDLSPPFDMAFVYRSRKAKLLVKRPEDGWREPVNAHGASTFELRDREVLSRFSFAYGGTGPGQVRYGAATMGTAGGLGLRDPGAVRYADGTPYITDGELYIAFTAAGNPHPGGWSSSYFGIFALDLETYAIRQTAALFFERDGIVYNDYAGHAVVDPDTDTMHVFTSTWGQSYEADVNVIHGTGDTSLLSGTNVVEAHVAVERAYDPNVVKMDGTWWMACVTPPNLTSVTFTDDSFTEFEVMGEGGEHLIEGPRFQRVGDDVRIVAARQEEYKMFTREMDELGELDAYHPTEDQSIHPPHPMLLALPTGDGQTKYILVTFDASGAFDESDGRREIGTLLVLHDQETLVCEHVHPFDAHDPG